MKNLTEEQQQVWTVLSRPPIEDLDDIFKVWHALMRKYSITKIADLLSGDNQLFLIRDEIDGLLRERGWSFDEIINHPKAKDLWMNT